MSLLDTIDFDVVLASVSPRRREILSLLFRDFRVVPSLVYEGDVKGEPADFTLELAKRKAAAVFRLNPASLVIGADTVVLCDGIPMGKPDSFSHAVEMLRALSGRAHDVITGVACLCPRFRFSFYEITKVVFRELFPEEIDWYVRTEEPYDKAGAYAIQGSASLFIERIEGNYQNVVGFPLAAFYNQLKGYMTMLGQNERN